jgi:hypothetical protein
MAPRTKRLPRKKVGFLQEGSREIGQILQKDSREERYRRVLQEGSREMADKDKAEQFFG